VKLNLVILLGVVVAVTALTLLLGAANFATALTFGEIAFVATLMWILLRRS
jgi:hypothetical protein